MKVLLDTNVLLRYINQADPQHQAIRPAVRRLAASGDALCITAQSVFEFWVVATRPPNVNGLGLPPTDAGREVEVLLATFTLLPDPPDILQRWLDLCTTHALCGRPAHDARLVAVMLAHGINRLFALNPDDFKRYLEIACLAPADV